MLLEFRVKNFKSIRESQTLSFVASERDKESLPGNCMTLDLPGSDSVRVLRGLAIYGANASGKSNLIQALSFVRWFVLSSARMLGPSDETKVIGFGEAGSTPENPSEFNVSFVHGNVLYKLVLKLTPERVLEETLEAYPEGRKQTWYRRTWDDAKSDYTYQPAESSTFPRDRKQEEFTRPNALFLSTAVQLNNERLKPVYEWFSSGLRSGIPEFNLVATRPLYRGPVTRFKSTIQCLQSGGPLAVRLRDLVAHADVGVKDVRVSTAEVEMDVFDPDNPDNPGKIAETKTRVALKHTGPEGRDFELELGQESAGTQQFFHLAGPWLQMLGEDVTLCLDEFDRSLHPFLTQALLSVVLSKQDGGPGPQILFTTHNPLLLDLSFLRRDQVWFVEKDREGASHLYPLTNYKPRKEESILRGYLEGRYGGIPFIPDGLLPETAALNADAKG